MPCYDPDSINGMYTASQLSDARHEGVVEKNKRRKVEAMLCAVLTVLQRHRAPDVLENDLSWYLGRVDWKEAGVTRAELEQWWRDHQEEDRRRHQSEARKASTRKQRAR